MRSRRSSARRKRGTAARICGSKNGSLRELRRGRRKFWTSSALRKPFRKSKRAMHSDAQISLHGIAPPFRSSHGGRIHRCCTDQFIYYLASDKATTHTEIRQLVSRKTVSGAMRHRIAFKRARVLFMLDQK